MANGYLKVEEQYGNTTSERYWWSMVWESLKNTAKSQNRSVSREVIYIIAKYLQNPAQFAINQTKEFLALSGPWVDDKTSNEIISSIKHNNGG